MGNDTKGPQLRFPNFPPKDDGQRSHALWLDVSDCALYLMKTKARFFWNPTRPYFNQYWCFWQIFFSLFFQLDLLLSGYVNDSSQDAVQLVRELFHEIPSLPKSQNLRIREWRIVLSLLRKTLKVWFFITDGYVEFIPETRISQDSRIKFDWKKKKQFSGICTKSIQLRIRIFIFYPFEKILTLFTAMHRYEFWAYTYFKSKINVYLCWNSNF